MKELNKIAENLSDLKKLELDKPTSLRDVRVYQRYLEYSEAMPDKKTEEIRKAVGVDFNISIESVGTILYVKLYRLIKHLEEK